MLKPGMAMLVHGPLDFVVGVIEEVSGAYLKMSAGCVTTRNIANQTQLVATCKPCNSDYVVCPNGHIVPLMQATGFTLLDHYDPADWPKQE
ncbi:MAG: hypothetical protein U0840_25610 [Gemmataceae bacterium]